MWQRTGEIAREVGAAVMSSLLLAAEGPDGAARGLRVLRGLRSNNDGWQAPVWLAPLLATAEARVLAARGDLDEARVALETHANGRPAEDALLRARLLLASGDAEQALNELDLTRQPSAELEFSRRIEANVLERSPARAQRPRRRCHADRGCPRARGAGQLPPAVRRRRSGSRRCSSSRSGAAPTTVRSSPT